jgi:protein-L-isoaspartate O-methyltransferase
MSNRVDTTRLTQTNKQSGKKKKKKKKNSKKTVKKLLNRTPRYGKVEVDDQFKHAAYENEPMTLQSTLIIVEQCTSQ